MKVNEVRKIESIETEFLKLSNNDKVCLTSIAHNTKRGFFNADTESLLVELTLFDEDIGGVRVCIDTKSQKQVENLQVILEMLQGSI